MVKYHAPPLFLALENTTGNLKSANNSECTTTYRFLQSTLYGPRRILHVVLHLGNHIIGNFQIILVPIDDGDILIILVDDRRSTESAYRNYINYVFPILVTTVGQDYAFREITGRQRSFERLD